jgi:hypothetical protein
MSVWTHVNGSVRVDGFLYSRENEIKKALGKIVNYDDDDWDTDLPCGSEGSLKYTVWTNPDESHIAKHTINIFGDLRDYNDSESIKEWFESVIKKLNPFSIRDAVLTVDVEFGEMFVYVLKKKELNNEDELDWEIIAFNYK